MNIKAIAREILTFIAYFPLMVGDLVCLYYINNARIGYIKKAWLQDLHIDICRLTKKLLNRQATALVV